MLPRKKLIASLFLSLFLASSFSLDAKTLKIATLAPDGTSWMQAMRTAAKEIAEKTEGRVKIKFYPGGVMGNDKNVLRKMRVGQLHGGAVTVGSLTEIFSNSQIYSLPLQFKSIEEVNFVRSKMDDMLNQGFEENGLVSIGISNGGFAYLFSKKPVASIGDLKGQRVWVPQGDIVGKVTFEGGGVSPVALPLSDVFTGLQTDLLDIVFATPTAAIAFQWHTKVKHMLASPMLFVVGVLVVDKKAFDKIKPDDQVILRNTMRAAFKELDDLNQKDNENALLALQKIGIKLSKPEAAETEKWQGLAESALKSLEQDNVYTVEYLKILKQHINAYRQQEK